MFDAPRKAQPRHEFDRRSEVFDTSTATTKEKLIPRVKAGGMWRRIEVWKCRNVERQAGILHLGIRHDEILGGVDGATSPYVDLVNHLVDVKGVPH